VKELYKVGDDLRDAADMPAADLYKNRRNLNELAYQSLWGWEYNYRFINPDLDGVYPLWMKMGTNKLAEDLADYTSLLSEKDEIGEDEINEYRVTERVLRSVDYRGHTSVYAGSLEVTSQQTQIAEFDGVILFLGNDAADRVCIVIGAKNTRHASTEARGDLEDKVEALKMTNWTYNVVECENGAYLEIYS
jgi:predicted nucleic-acid-binding Zn-ribbon protein